MKMCLFNLLLRILLERCIRLKLLQICVGLTESFLGKLEWQYNPKSLGEKFEYFLSFFPSQFELCKTPGIDLANFHMVLL